MYEYLFANRPNSGTVATNVSKFSGYLQGAPTMVSGAKKLWWSVGEGDIKFVSFAFLAQ